jgi:gluconate 2-dehydrogenase subunit 3-like protein
MPLSQNAAFVAVLDAIVPRSPDGRLPAAGELGLAAAIEASLGAMCPLVARSLDALDALARERCGAAFAALPSAEREEILNAHAVGDPAFLGGLVFQTYCAYYQHPRVVAALGLAARPPHPEGYPLEQPDLDALLAPVRERATRYREA